MTTYRKTSIALVAALAVACGGTDTDAQLDAPIPGYSDMESDLPEVPLDPSLLAEFSAAATSSGFVATQATRHVGSHSPANAIDGLLATRWSARGIGVEIVGELDAAQPVTSLGIAWHRGTVRRVSFEIHARRSDGSYALLFSGQSSGTTSGIERYTFPAVTTDALKVQVNGNTENEWAGITEMRAGLTATPAPEPAPAPAPAPAPEPAPAPAPAPAPEPAPAPAPAPAPEPAPAPAPAPEPAPAPAPVVSVSVSPSTTTVAAGSSVQFRATVTGTTNGTVTWTVQEGSAGGAIGSTGLYTAPSVAGTFHVIATSSADPTRRATATVTVTPLAGVSVGAPSGGDDTAAFNAAITAANGGLVTVPGSGTYLVRAVAVNRANTTIVCTGSPAATIKLRALASGDGSPILNVTAGGFTLRGCVLDGNKAAQPAGGFNDSYNGRVFRTAIKMDGWHTGLTVERATFQNVYGAAIAPRNVSAIRVTDSVFRDNNFEAVFANNSYPVSDPTTYLDGFTFLRNTVTNTRSRHTSVNANGMLVFKMRNVSIQDNLWDGFERNAMKLENCRQGTVANNRIRNNDIGGFAAIGLQNGAHHLVISGNQISNTGAGIDTSLVVGGQYMPDTVDNLTITGNTISGIRTGSMPDGIRILGYGSATTDIVISNNTIQSVPRYGINLRQFTTFYASPTFTRITVRDNRLTSAGSCTNWFAATVVSPTNVTSTNNVCN